MRNSMMVVAVIGACIFASGCRDEPKRAPVEVTQEVTVPGKPPQPKTTDEINRETRFGF
jgi:Ni,Fe-hydrogenase III small subunit